MAVSDTISIHKPKILEKNEFIALLEKYHKGETSAVEEQMLINFCNSYQEGGSWDEVKMRGLEEAENRVFARLEAIINQPVQQPTGQRNVLTRTWLRYAAAVLILAGGAAIFRLAQPGKNDDGIAIVREDTITKDQSPGKDRATLTLSNGKKIELQSGESQVISDSSLSISNQNGIVVYGESDIELLNTMNTPRGGQYRLILPDSSKVWLNAASSITYPTSFKGNERKVSVSGEVYFEVAANKQKPFRVDVNGMQVEVLGTHFNVMAYEEEKEIKTTLLEGSVKVISGNDHLMLSNSQQALLSRSSPRLKLVNDVNTDEVTAWLRGEMRFDNAGIESIMIQIARWYDISVEYEKGVDDITFTGNIFRRYSLLQVLEILETTHKLSFTLQGNRVIVKKYVRK